MHDKLRLEMRIQNISIKKLSIMIGMKYSTIIKKFSEKREFTQSEIKLICESLNKNFNEIF